MTLNLCTLFKGVPYGPALISFDNPNNKGSSFKGVGIFTNGKLDSGPFTYIDGDENSFSMSLMKNGRRADTHCGS